MPWYKRGLFSAPHPPLPPPRRKSTPSMKDEAPSHPAPKPPQPHRKMDHQLPPPPREASVTFVKMIFTLPVCVRVLEAPSHQTVQFPLSLYVLIGTTRLDHKHLSHLPDGLSHSLSLSCSLFTSVTLITSDTHTHTHTHTPTHTHTHTHTRVRAHTHTPGPILADHYCPGFLKIGSPSDSVYQYISVPSVLQEFPKYLKY